MCKHHDSSHYINNRKREKKQMNIWNTKRKKLLKSCCGGKVERNMETNGKNHWNEERKWVVIKNKTQKVCIYLDDEK